MILVTGGAFQGKLDFAKKLTKKESPRIAAGDRADLEEMNRAEVAADFHLYLKRLLEQGLDPYQEVKVLSIQNPGVIITVAELGCGIVPAEAFDRNWREVTGRICCLLAKEAEEVYRVTCGIPVKLK